MNYSMAKISFVMITARTDYPYTGRPALHLFEPTLESFKAQTMHDFEWIIVDALYDQRKDYFAKLELPFKIKHIPALPNLWLSNGLPAVSTQWNKGIIYADGELLFFTGDSYMVQPNFMENLWTRYREGYFPLAWYLYDNTFATCRESIIDKEKFDVSYPVQHSEAPVQYNIIGYTGKKVELEHRYTRCFENNDLERRIVPWDWWFGCSSASLEAILKINGFDQNFDPDRMLVDCDVGSRLEMAGYGMRFALFRNIYLIKAPATREWNPSFKKDMTIKCNYALIGYSRAFEHYRANRTDLTDQDIRWIKENFCSKRCTHREFCKREHPWQYPFEHKSGYPGHQCSKRWFNFWKDHQAIIDLAQEREKRLNDDPKYERGTFS